MPLYQFIWASSPRSATAASYAVTYTDFPPGSRVSDKDAVFNEGRDGLQKKFGVPRSERIISLQERPGRDMEFETNNGTNRIFMRVYLASHRHYQMVAIVPMKNDASTNTWRFLDSFKFEAGAPR